MLSAIFKNNQWQFKVWAPEKKQMILHVVNPFDAELPMQKQDDGYFTVDVKTEEKQLQYFFKPDNEKDLPDPASQFQPNGVHGASQTIDHSHFGWNDDNWRGISLSDCIIYELHVGLFTPEGTFEAAINRLDDLVDAGINAIELMPVAQFPGDRNWGYDGVFPYAVQNSYGGPGGLKKLVDACHQRGIAVIVDVVYNHMGPEGNYFSRFGPYFTNKYHTPWGDAINLDDAWSDGVRDFFSDNMIHWFENYHIDGLRCDAIHAIFDSGALNFWELAYHKIRSLERKLGRNFFVIAESDLNDPKVIKSPERCGYGFDAQWLDDFHHALYALINPSDEQRYYDFGTMNQLTKAYNDGFVFSGEWVKFRKKKFGASSANIPGNQFVVFSQNHDQIGNRADGKRLNQLVGFERVKLAAAAILLAPYVPMLFMGEEYADDSPFFYFVSHSDTELIKAVREGRKKEFEHFGFNENVPDPQDENTFSRCKLNWGQRNEGQHEIILNWYKELIRLRKTIASLKNFQKKDICAEVINEKAFVLFRHTTAKEKGIICLFNFSEEKINYAPPIKKTVHKILDSKENRWMPGSNQKALPHADTIKSNDDIELLPVSVVVYSY